MVGRLLVVTNGKIGSVSDTVIMSPELLKLSPKAIQSERNRINDSNPRYVVL